MGQEVGRFFVGNKGTELSGCESNQRRPGATVPKFSEWDGFSRALPQQTPTASTHKKQKPASGGSSSSSHSAPPVKPPAGDKAAQKAANAANAAKRLAKKSSAVEKQSQVEVIANRNAASFVDELVRPDECAVRFPLNTVDTAVGKCKIAVSSPHHDEYGRQMIVALPNPEAPLYVTKGSQTFQSAGAVSDVFGSTQVQFGPGENQAYFVGFLNCGSVGIIAPARDDASQIPAYYRLTYDTAGPQLNLTVDDPTHVVFILMLRNNVGTWVDQAPVQIRPGTTNYNIAVGLAGNPTAFAFRFMRNSGGVNRNGMDTKVTISLIPQVNTALTVGNHSEVLVPYNTPEVEAYRFRRAKVTALKALWSCTDAIAYVKGNIITAQFPPGVFHSEYSGETPFDQAVNSRVRHLYRGHASKGACNIYVPPSIDNLYINAPNQDFNNSGYILFWNDGKNTNSSEPTSYLFQLWYVVEYTSFQRIADPDLPMFSDFDAVQSAFYLLSRMPLASENPHHKYLTAAWQWMKRNAAQVITNPKTYETLGAIIAAAAL